MNTLNEQQIDHLFSFVRSKYVHYIDVQYEIVDHLATAIEEEMEKDAKLSFEAALSTVYKRFPVTGFTNWVAEREKSMHRYWLKKVFSFLLSYLNLPKIIGTATLFFVIFHSFKVVYYPKEVWMFSVLCISIYAIYKMNKRMGLTEKEKGQYLVMVTHLGVSSSFSLSIFIGSMSNFSFEASRVYSDGTLIIFSMFFTFLFVYSHAMMIAFPQMIKDELEKKYSHLGLHKKFA